MTHRCTGGFAFFREGQPVVFAGGALVADDDPILETHGAHFERAEEFTARRSAIPQSVGAVETATAEPGEQRVTSRPTATRRAGRAMSSDEE